MRSNKLKPGKRLRSNIGRVVHRKRRHPSSVATHSMRTRVHRDQEQPFQPPEDWHEPVGRETYRFVIQDPGEGFRHAVTAEAVRERLSRVPQRFLAGLETIQFSRMTRKKQAFPCYGMQWGSTIYLYPVEKTLIETYGKPPRPAERNEAAMYGGRWEPGPGRNWRLIWTPESIQNFYLNNILIHELGHLVDERNSRSNDRERYAEWFAVQYGYKPSRRPARKVRRRHHNC